MSLDTCRLISFPKISDQRGNLSVIEGGRHIPFDIARVYYLYDVPGGESRGGHAHKAMSQVVVAINGSFDVELDDGSAKKVFHLRTANEGLYIERMVWRELTCFSSGSVCLSLASTPFDENDYLRDYKAFLGALGKP